MTMKELSWKKPAELKNIVIEDYKRNIVGERRQVLKIWENYISEFYDRPSRPENQEV